LVGRSESSERASLSVLESPPLNSQNEREREKEKDKDKDKDKGPLKGTWKGKGKGVVAERGS
jgi:hypothetical protein